MADYVKPMADYVRFQSTVPNRHGRYPGVFALANGPAQEGTLATADRRLWRQENDQMNASYAHPTESDPDCYDPKTHPRAAVWFKLDGGRQLIDRTSFYLDLLNKYNVKWMELRTTSPGRIHYEDLVQVEATPWAYPQDWTFY